MLYDASVRLDWSFVCVSAGVYVCNDTFPQMSLLLVVSHTQTPALCVCIA